MPTIFDITVSALHLPDLLICVAAGTLSILWFEILKLVNRKKTGLPAFNG
jgi:hypothetical protein